MYYGQIIGVRIINSVQTSDEHKILYEFKYDNLNENAINIISQYIGLNTVKIQTLHHFSKSYHLKTGLIQEPGDIWLDNPYFTVDSLY